MRYPYGEHEQARWVAEPGKVSYLPGTAPIIRTQFQRDRARVLHSFALRRLAATTQVSVPGEHDFPRTRLTHSLEVAQIGREMGTFLGCDPDVVDAACLAHDLGHPPFGHNGEAALDEVARPIGGFEGNAQTLRILTRLEAKVRDAGGRSAGLNLTRATLDAAAKYPWQRQPDSPKFGVYADDLEVFEWLRSGAPPGRRCLEAQVMDWADDVAYSVHDVEDGIHTGHIRLPALADPGERAAVCALTAERYSPESPGDLEEVLTGLLDLPVLREVAGYDGGFAAQVALKRATSELVGRFAAGAVTATRDKAGAGPLGRYAADLVVPRQIGAECALLKGVAAWYMLFRAEFATLREQQREIVTGLVTLLSARAPGELEQPLRADWEAATDDAARLRVVIDQVAHLTDTSATAWHERLAGRP